MSAASLRVGSLFLEAPIGTIGWESVDPYQDWLSNGYTEGRRPNRYFDTSWHKMIYGIAAGVNSLTDYHTVGWQFGRNPSPSFSTAGYSTSNADVAVAGVDPLVHSLSNGYSERRSAVAAP